MKNKQWSVEQLMKYIDHSVYREVRKQSSSQGHEPQQGRELSYAERTKPDLLAELLTVYERYPVHAHQSAMSLRDRVKVEAIEEELEEREEYEAKVRGRW